MKYSVDTYRLYQSEKYFSHTVRMDYNYDIFRQE